jgi:hypothetical protein
MMPTTQLLEVLADCLTVLEALPYRSETLLAGVREQIDLWTDAEMDARAGDEQ